MKNADDYAVLGLTEDCSDAELRSAWMKFVRKHHPDRGGGEHETFIRGNNAYNRLSMRSQHVDTVVDGSNAVGFDGTVASAVAMPTATPMPPILHASTGMITTIAHFVIGNIFHILYATIVPSVLALLQCLYFVLQVSVQSGGYFLPGMASVASFLQGLLRGSSQSVMLWFQRKLHRIGWHVWHFLLKRQMPHFDEITNPLTFAIPETTRSRLFQDHDELALVMLVLAEDHLKRHGLRAMHEHLVQLQRTYKNVTTKLKKELSKAECVIYLSMYQVQLSTYSISKLHNALWSFAQAVPDSTGVASPRFYNYPRSTIGIARSNYDEEDDAVTLEKDW